MIRNQIDAAIAQLQSDAARSVMPLRLDAEAERAAVSIEPLEIEAFDRLPSMMADATFPAVEAAYWHRPFLAARREAEYDPFVLARIDAGTRMPAWAYAGLVEARRNFIAEIEAKTIGLSALVWPTVPQFAPSIASLSDGETYRSVNALMLRNSTIANLLDACAISIPCPDTPRPVGLTIAAAGGADDFLMAVADVCQRILTKKEI
ncbi:amidase family protein [Novosphingobium lubricantis]